MQEETRLQRRTVLTATGSAALLGVAGVANAKTGSTVANAPVPDSPSAYTYPTMGTGGDGTPTARVYGNFKCPYTKGFVSGNFPKIIEKFVETGRLQIQFCNLAYEPGSAATYFISGSDPRCAAMGLGTWDEDPDGYWQFFAETFADPPSGYVDPDELASRARSAGVSNAGAIADRVQAGEYSAEVDRISAEAASDGVTFTPTLELAGDTTAPHHGTQALFDWIESRLNSEPAESSGKTTENAEEPSETDSESSTDSDAKRPDDSGGSGPRETTDSSDSSAQTPADTCEPVWGQDESDSNVIETQMKTVDDGGNGNAIWEDSGSEFWGVDDDDC